MASHTFVVRISESGDVSTYDQLPEVRSNGRTGRVFVIESICLFNSLAQ